MHNGINTLVSMAMEEKSRRYLSMRKVQGAETRGGCLLVMAIVPTSVPADMSRMEFEPAIRRGSNGSPETRNAGRITAIQRGW